MKRVYIAYPFADNPAKRKEENRELLRNLVRWHKDTLFVSPLLLFDCYATDEGIRDEILCVCCDLVVLCDELWVYGDSEGIRMEIEAAKAADIKIVKKVG